MQVFEAPQGTEVNTQCFEAPPVSEALSESGSAQAALAALAGEQEFVSTPPTSAHLEEGRLETFYMQWVECPDAVGDDEFDEIHLHLLECPECAARAKRCEDRCRELNPESEPLRDSLTFPNSDFAEQPLRYSTTSRRNASAA